LLDRLLMTQSGHRSGPLYSRWRYHELISTRYGFDVE
jgi:hypothetical protein